MQIPEPTDFAEWNAGRIGDAELARIEAFFREMLAGAEALGPRYSIAAMTLRAEHNAAAAMLARRREPPNPYSVTFGTADPAAILRN